MGSTQKDTQIKLHKLVDGNGFLLRTAKSSQGFFHVLRVPRFGSPFFCQLGGALASRPKLLTPQSPQSQWSLASRDRETN